MVVASQLTDDLATYLPDPLRPDRPEGRRWKSKGSRSLTEVPEGFLLKHFYPRNLWRCILHTFLPAPASNSFRNQVALQRAGLPIADALACVVVRRPFPIYRESFFLQSQIPNAINLRDYFHDRVDLFAGTNPARLLHHVSVARLIARFHEAGFFHQDLHAKNILLAGDLHSPDYYLIDFDGSVRLGGLPRWIFMIFRFLDLRRFYCSLRFWIRRTDRERFLRAYFGTTPEANRQRRLFHRFLKFINRLSRQEEKMRHRDEKAMRTLGLPPRR